MAISEYFLFFGTEYVHKISAILAFKIGEISSLTILDRYKFSSSVKSIGKKERLFSKVMRGWNGSFLLSKLRIGEQIFAKRVRVFFSLPSGLSLLI